MLKNKPLIQLCIIITLCFTGSKIFSQALEGKVMDSNKVPLSDVIVKVIKESGNLKFLTNEKGVFQIEKKLISSDTLFFILSKPGYMTVRKEISKNKIKGKLRFILKKERANTLDEVVVMGKQSVIDKPNKTIYKIDPNEYKVNTTTDIALKSLPNVFITKDGLIIDGRKGALIFIDGIVSTLEELKTLDIKSVDKIEVISNPSARYGSELSGGVIQILTKRTKKRYIKGKLHTYAALRPGSSLSYQGVFPSVSFKTKSITFNGLYDYKTNHQEMNREVERSYKNMTLNENSFRKVTGWQDYLSSRMRVYLSSKSIFYFSGSLFRYHFKGEKNGSYYQNVEEDKEFNRSSVEKLNNGSLSGMYNYNFSKNEKLMAKYKYLNYMYEDDFNYSSSHHHYGDNVSSHLKEHAAEVVYQKNKAKFSEFPVEYSTGYKSLFRNYTFNQPNFSLKQKINSIYTDFNIKIHPRLSLFTSLFYDISQNESQNNKQNYHFFLPTLSGLYKWADNFSVRFNYSRKLTRPSPENLNSSPSFSSPTYIVHGNPKLEPATREVFEIKLNKPLEKRNSVSLNIYSEQTHDGIVETKLNKKDTVITSFENAGKIHTQGINLGINTKLFKLLSLNFNTGAKYSSFNSDNDNSLIKKNDGFSFSTSLFLYALIKKDFSVSFSGFFNSPIYTLTSKGKRNPYLSFELEKSFLKDKLEVSLSCDDLLGIYGKTTDNMVYDNFSEHIKTFTKFPNISFSITYHLGKSFNSRFDAPAIHNDDIQLKGK